MDSVERLRKVGIAEGLSFLCLLSIAMPLKYVWGIPIAVKWVGWLHGLLFVLYCGALYQAREDRSWKLSRCALLFIAALVPFGPFLADRTLKREASATREGA